jgi:hypothetical protein
MGKGVGYGWVSVRIMGYDYVDGLVLRFCLGYGLGVKATWV